MSARRQATEESDAASSDDMENSASDDASDASSSDGSDSDDAGGSSEGDVVGFERPSLLKDLRNILAEYPDGQIFKEMIQNAEDAGASTVKIFSVNKTKVQQRSAPQSTTPKTKSQEPETTGASRKPTAQEDENAKHWRPPFCKIFSVPGFCIYNDAKFTEEDWSGIRKLHTSVKAKDPLKVGRFGLGFKSVFHVTDYPVIISGHKLMFMDPFKDEKNAIFEMPLKSLTTKEHQALNCILTGVLHMLPERSLTWKRFKGTLFWFPLREAPSELSGTVYNQERVRQLKQALRSEVSMLPLFLKRMEKIEVYSGHGESHTNPTLDFSASLTDDCLRDVRKQRKRFISAITTDNKRCPKKKVSIASCLNVKTGVRENDVTRFTIDKWVVLNFHHGLDEMSPELKTLCQRHSLTHRPYVGVAAKVNRQPDDFQGQVFCFLPLPLEKVSPTGLPVHVNGFFELSQNRRQVKWPSSGQEEEPAMSDDALLWNQFLVREVIPLAYVTLVSELVKLNLPGAQLQSSTHIYPRSSLVQRDLIYGICPNNDRVTFRWEPLLKTFYQLFAVRDYKVFSHKHGWVAFSSAWFFDPEFKETAVGKVAFRVLQTFWSETEWKTKRNGVLVDVPHSIVRNIRDARQRQISEVEFFTEVLFPRLSGEEESALDVHDRNLLVLHALMSDNKQLQDLVKSNPCIPCQPDGVLKLPSQLVHPKGAAAPLFTVNSARFPQRADGADFCQRDVLTKLVKMGMVRNRLPCKEVVKQAQAVKKIANTNMSIAVQRALALVRYLSPDNLGQDLQSVTQAMSEVKFLPVLQKPAHWPFTWHGDGEKFVAPCEAFGNSVKVKELVACQAYILDDQSEATRGLKQHESTLESLGVTLYKAHGSTEFVQTVMDQLITISGSGYEQTEQDTQHVETVTTMIYKFLCKESRKHDRSERFDRLKDEAVVWTKFGFQEARRVAFSCTADCSPYLIALDSHLAKIAPDFFRELGVKEGFDAEDALSALEEIQSDKGSSQMTEEDVDLVVNVALLLSKVVKGKPLDDSQLQNVHLPDSNGWLHPVSELCHSHGDQDDWVTESDSMKFLHDKVSPHLARLFRVRSKRECDEDDYTEPFGQHEELTNRINRLLEGYTRDEAIFKELLQNADDAGATEVRFVMDLKRTHSEDRLMNDSWKELLGPSLCVYNDASFTQKDMKGIQDLGQGSKGDEVLKTGKYGVGFNAVYNLTDTPCFWTRVDGEKETVCVLDPNFFVVKRKKRPGIRLKIDDRFHSLYPDMLKPFIVNEQGSTKQQSGTVFRLPLRTPERANTEHMNRGKGQTKATRSKIRQDAMDPEDLERLLREFQPKMGECLLFLNNVKKVGVYSIQQDGTLHGEYETQLTANEDNTALKNDFNKHVNQQAKKLGTGPEGHRLTDFQPREVTVHLQLSDTQGKREEWLVVKKFGLREPVASLKCNSQNVRKHRLLPLAGVALCVSALREQERQQRSTQITETSHQRRDFHAYCTLPLPVVTGLPVHVNGCFALDHETRRNIDTKPHSFLAKWNRLLVEKCIVPAFIKALHEGKSSLFSEEQVSLPPLPQGSQEAHHTEKSKAYQDGRKRKNPYQDTVSWKRNKSATPDKARASPVCNDYGGFEKKLSIFNNFFPDVSDNVDVFWRSLVQEFYKQLAQNEDDVFPVVREDLQRLLFVSGVRSQGFPGHFWDDQNTKKSRKSLKSILLRLNMNIIQSPFRIYSAFIDSKVQEVRRVDEETVIEFLESCQEDAKESDSACNLKDLPKPVEETPLRSAAEVVKVFQFVSEKAETLEGLPLSLRESGKLHLFHNASPTIVSKFADLLPESKDQFLISDLIEFASKHMDTDKNVLEKLSIKRLASLLPRSVDKKFGSGKVCEMADATEANQKLPNAKWICRVWEFLEKELPPKDVGNWKAVGSHLQCLSDWSLIPVHKYGPVQLFPLRDRHLVVYICKRPLQRSKDTLTQSCLSSKKEELPLQSLRKLPLNRLDVGILRQDLATRIVASIKQPNALLTALRQVDLKDSEFDKDDGEIILDFFHRKLPQMSDTEVMDVRSLPFFERPDGCLISVPPESTTLCLPDNIQPVGLDEWVANAGVILLKYNVNLHRLYTQLGFKTPRALEFYTEFLVPQIQHLPVEAIRQHMKYIRDKILPDPANDTSELIMKLRQTPFIRGVDGTLRKASDFYSPYVDVFRVMLNQDRFPTTPYNGKKWRNFLESIGMICEVSADDFWRFAQRVEEGGKTVVTEQVKQQSTELCKYFFRTKSLHKKKPFLERLRTCQFLLSKPVTDLDKGHVLTKIHQQFSSPTPLLTFAEGCSQTYAHLVWTSQALLEDHADPVKQGLPEELYKPLGFICQPAKETVIEHIKNVCLTLKKRKGRWIIEHHFDVLESIMEDFYVTLRDYESKDLQHLKDLPFIFHEEEKALFPPSQVVINLTEEQKVKGHIVRAPEKFGQFFAFFRKLGVYDEPIANHYAETLKRLHGEFKEDVLDPNALELVKTSIDSLFKCLKSKQSSASPLSVEPVYLPCITVGNDTPDSVTSVRLGDSRQLILEVTEQQKKRVRSPTDDLLVFLGFRELDLEARDLHRDVNHLLPEAHRMKLWQDVINETLADSCASDAFEDGDTRFFQERIRSQEFLWAVLRLVNHKKLKETESFSEVEQKKISEKLQAFSVRKVTFLKTVLMRNGSKLPDSEEESCFFLEFAPRQEDPGASTTPETSATLYADAKQDFSKDCSNSRLMFQLKRAVCFMAGSLDDKMLDVCLRDPLTADQFLGEQGVPKLQVPFKKHVFPPPGSFVPESLQGLLDDDVYEFESGEYVACELYDPCLRFGEDDNTDETETPDAENDYKKPQRPIYIYAKVAGVKEQPSDGDIRRRLLVKQYTIEVGEEGLKTVGACELYKFTRSDSTHTTLSAFSVTNTEDDTKVLEEIRGQLLDIWAAFTTEKDRMRAVKRLTLKWHPAKNKKLEDMCKMMYLHIRQCISYLHRKGKLPSEINITHEMGPGAFSRYHNKGRYGNYFQTLTNRGLNQAKSSNTMSRYRSGMPNPQPEEGKRWLRQAGLDLDTATLTLRETKTRGWRLFNWVCYEAHQAAEKALKAVAFSRDCSTCQKNSHNIRDLANSLGDPSITKPADDLHDLVGYHTLMRYPDLTDFPKIPADLYDEDKAKKALELAEAIINKAKTLIRLAGTSGSSHTRGKRPSTTTHHSNPKQSRRS